MDNETRAFLRRTQLDCPLPYGTRVRVTKPMPDDPDPLPVGAEGTVLGGNGAQLWMDWDGGRSLALLVDHDPYEVIGIEIEEFVKGVRSALPTLQDLQLTQSPGGHLTLSMIRVHRDHRRKGTAERTMQLVTDLADVHGLILSATASPPDAERPSTKIAPLKRWLTRHRIRPNHGRYHRAEISERYFRVPRDPCPRRSDGPHA